MHLARLLSVLVAMGFFHAAGAQETEATAHHPVVVLHGLARSSDSMTRLVQSLQTAGLHVCNIAYPSREHSIEALTADFVAPAIRACVRDPDRPVDFVTHSLGGIVVRQLAATSPDISIGRVVMLSPPNGGSEVVDKLGDLYLFELANGPAGRQLGTQSGSLPRTLGPARFELGVITGNRSINLILSMLIPGSDDGKVSVANARLEGMKDFLVVAASHPFIMKDRQVIEQTLHFLRTGRFVHDADQEQLT